MQGWWITIFSFFGLLTVFYFAHLSSFKTLFCYVDCLLCSRWLFRIIKLSIVANFVNIDHRCFLGVNLFTTHTSHQICLNSLRVNLIVSYLSDLMMRDEWLILLFRILGVDKLTSWICIIQIDRANLLFRSRLIIQLFLGMGSKCMIVLSLLLPQYFVGLVNMIFTSCFRGFYFSCDFLFKRRLFLCANHQFTRPCLRNL